MSSHHTRGPEFNLENTIAVYVTIVTLLCFVLGTIFLEMTCFKIVKTAGQLIGYSSEATYYNEQRIKTDAMSDEYVKMNEERQQIYNSEDIVIRTFSRLHGLIKFLVLILAIITIFATPFVMVIKAVRTVRTIMRRWERKNSNRACNRTVRARRSC